MPPALEVALACWLSVVAIQAVRKRDRRLVQLLLVSIFSNAAIFGVGVALALLDRFTLKYDMWLYATEVALGSPAFIISRLMAPTALYPLLVCVYDAMPMVLLFVYAVHLLRNGTPERVLGAFVLNFAAGYCLYMILPACGPSYTFAGFPAVTPPAPVLHALKIAAPPNCLPSLHLSTALLAFWFCRPWRLARAAALVNLLLTALATLVTGEHYTVDLVVAVPFAAFVEAAARRQFRAAASWLSLTVAWCVALRVASPFLTTSPGILMSLCLLTVGPCALLRFHRSLILPRPAAACKPAPVAPN